MNPVGRWKAPFNLGTAKYVAESPWGAREPLGRALELVDAGEDYPDDAPWGTAIPEELGDDARRYAGWAESDYAIATEARAERQEQAGGGGGQDEGDGEGSDGGTEGDGDEEGSDGGTKGW